MTIKYMKKTSHSSDCMLQFSGFSFTYDKPETDESWVLRIDEVCVPSGSLLLVKGDNMSGKSTFLNLISGIQPFNMNGSIVSINGREVNHFSDLQSQSILLSNSDDMFLDLSIWDNIKVALPAISRNKALSRQNVCAKFLMQSGIFNSEDVYRALGDLSSGGRVFVKLCRAIAAPHKIIVVDELTSYLDEKRSRLFLDKIIEFIIDGSAVVLVSHSERDRSYLVKELESKKALINQATIFRRENISEFVNEK